MTDNDQRPSSLSGWVTVRQAAGIKKVTPKAVYNRLRTGELQHSRLGEVVLIRRVDLDSWQVNRNIQAAHKKTWRKKRGQPVEEGEQTEEG